MDSLVIESDRSIIKNGPIPASFCFIFVLFSLQFQHKLKKHRWWAWDLNPGPQDGRRRQNHGAMTTQLLSSSILIGCLNFFIQSECSKPA